MKEKSLKIARYVIKVLVIEIKSIWEVHELLYFAIQMWNLSIQLCCSWRREALKIAWYGIKVLWDQECFKYMNYFTLQFKCEICQFNFVHEGEKPFRPLSGMKGIGYFQNFGNFYGILREFLGNSLGSHLCTSQILWSL